MGAAVGEGEMAWGYDDKFFFFSAKNSYVWLKLSVHPPPPWDRHRQKGPIIVLCQKRKWKRTQRAASLAISLAHESVTTPTYFVSEWWSGIEPRVHKAAIYSQLARFIPPRKPSLWLAWGGLGNPCCCIKVCKLAAIFCSTDAFIPGTYF